ncbi:hypothetical protein [Rhodococcus qingshengii]|uniref:hypothetical protein n=1 Tax=Rhodococcus qingshengii TaxID=334542 RepID=UPI000A60B709
MSALREADPGGVPKVCTVPISGRHGTLDAGRNLILLSDKLSVREAAFGEAHLRFHASTRGAGDCEEANQVAAIHLIPSVRLMEVALRESGTAVGAADELGVAVHVLSHRIEGLAVIDSILAASLWCEVDWPADGEMQGFECVVADISVEHASRVRSSRRAA